VYLLREPKGGFIANSDDSDSEDEEFDEEMYIDEGLDCNMDSLTIDDNDNHGQKKHSPLSAIKVQSPVNYWEFFVLVNLRSRLPPRNLPSIIQPYSCHVFPDASCLRLKYSNQGTILEAVNRSLNGGYGLGAGTLDKDGGVDELLAAFWTIELLRTIESIHVAGYVHGDIKADNVLVRLDRTSAWESTYSRDGHQGWASKGVVLIDFGTAIDLFSFPTDQKFYIESAHESEGGSKKRREEQGVECWEVRNRIPCRYEPDWYGAAGIIHILLFGRYMQLDEIQDGDGKPTLKVRATFKRYWQADLWKSMIDVLLNETTGQSPNSPALSADEELSDDLLELAEEFPRVLSIRKIRTEMENWLQKSCLKSGKSLKSLLQRVEMASLGTFQFP
jgi:checkpoint serine/threonine-protein kinase